MPPPAASPTPSTVVQRIAASVATIGIADGVMGLATFGTFDDDDQGTTTSVLAPVPDGH